VLAVRLSVRPILESLRLDTEQPRGVRRIAASLGLARSTVADHLRRFRESRPAGRCGGSPRAQCPTPVASDFGAGFPRAGAMLVQAGRLEADVEVVRPLTRQGGNGKFSLRG